MADNNRQYGFRWIRSIAGMPQPKPQRLRIASAYAPVVGATGVNINAGDPVLLTTDGTAIKAVGSEGTQTQVYGIAVAFGPRFDGSVMQPTNKYVSNTVYSTILERQSFVWVVPVVGALFEIDCDDNVTFTTEATYYGAIGENADMILTADTTDAGNPKMTPQLDISTHAVTSTLQCRIEDISQQVNMDFTGNYVKLYVSFNRVQQAPYQTTGI